MVRKIKVNNAAKIRKELAKAEKNAKKTTKIEKKPRIKPDKITWGIVIFSIIVISVIMFVNSIVQKNKLQKIEENNKQQPTTTTKIIEKTNQDSVKTENSKTNPNKSLKKEEISNTIKDTSNITNAITNKPKTPEIKVSN